MDNNELKSLNDEDDVTAFSDDKLLLYLRTFERFENNLLGQLAELKNRIAKNSEERATLSIEARRRGLIE